MLRFLGRNSAFYTNNNCAFFTRGSDLVLLDCPMSAFHKLRHARLEKLASGKTERVIVLVTHTHSDHTGGLGMLMHYCFYMLDIPVLVIAPSEQLKADIKTLLNLDGCDEQGYTLTSADKAGMDWIYAPIPTKHVEQLEGKCFGWALDIDGQRVVYTGDTCTFEPYIPYLTQGCSLYTEVASFESPVHLYIKELEPVLEKLKDLQMKIYFMHIDDEKCLEEPMKRLGAQLAPLYG